MSFISDQLRALGWVYEQRDRFNIAAVNLSLGGGRYRGSCDGPYRQIFALLWQAGIAVVVASGNSEYPDAISRPACIPNAIAVGATGYADNVAKFSNSGGELDLLAPGTSVVPAQRDSGILSSVLNGKFARHGGTSMADPHVSGAFAVIKSALPNARVDDVLKALTVTGVRVRDSKNGLVRPRIQIDAAIGYLRKLAARRKPPSPAPQPARQRRPKPDPKPEGRNHDGIRVFDGRDTKKDGKIKW
jgi:subtilisin family serine protease